MAAYDDGEEAALLVAEATMGALPGIGIHLISTPITDSPTTTSTPHVAAAAAAATTAVTTSGKPPLLLQETRIHSNAPQQPSVPASAAPAATAVVLKRRLGAAAQLLPNQQASAATTPPFFSSRVLHNASNHPLPWHARTRPPEHITATLEKNTAGRTPQRAAAATRASRSSSTYVANSATTKQQRLQAAAAVASPAQMRKQEEHMMLHAGAALAPAPATSTSAHLCRALMALHDRKMNYLESLPVRSEEPVEQAIEHSMHAFLARFRVVSASPVVAAATTADALVATSAILCEARLSSLHMMELALCYRPKQARALLYHPTYRSLQEVIGLVHGMVSRLLVTHAATLPMNSTVGTTNRSATGTTAMGIEGEYSPKKKSSDPSMAPPLLPFPSSSVAWDQQKEMFHKQKRPRPHGEAELDEVSAVEEEEQQEGQEKYDMLCAAEERKKKENVFCVVDRQCASLSAPPLLSVLDVNATVHDAMMEMSIRTMEERFQETNVVNVRALFERVPRLMDLRGWLHGLRQNGFQSFVCLSLMADLLVKAMCDLRLGAAPWNAAATAMAMKRKVQRRRRRRRCQEGAPASARGDDEIDSEDSDSDEEVDHVEVHFGGAINSAFTCLRTHIHAVLLSLGMDLSVDGHGVASADERRKAAPSSGTVGDGDADDASCAEPGGTHSVDKIQQEQEQDDTRSWSHKLKAVFFNPASTTSSSTQVVDWKAMTSVSGSNALAIFSENAWHIRVQALGAQLEVARRCRDFEKMAELRHSLNILQFGPNWGTGDLRVTPLAPVTSVLEAAGFDLRTRRQRQMDMARGLAMSGMRGLARGSSSIARVVWPRLVTVGHLSANLGTLLLGQSLHQVSRATGVLGETVLQAHERKVNSPGGWTGVQTTATVEILDSDKGDDAGEHLGVDNSVVGERIVPSGVIPCAPPLVSDSMATGARVASTSDAAMVSLSSRNGTRAKLVLEPSINGDEKKQDRVVNSSFDFMATLKEAAEESYRRRQQAYAQASTETFPVEQARNRQSVAPRHTVDDDGTVHGGIRSVMESLMRYRRSALSGEHAASPPTITKAKQPRVTAASPPTVTKAKQPHVTEVSVTSAPSVGQSRNSSKHRRMSASMTSEGEDEWDPDAIRDENGVWVVD